MILLKRKKKIKGKEKTEKKGKESDNKEINVIKKRR